MKDMFPGRYSSTVAAPGEFVRGVLFSRISLLDADGDFIAWAAEVGQTHGNGWSWRNAARHPDVHLVQARETGSQSKEQNLGRARPAED